MYNRRSFHTALGAAALSSFVAPNGLLGPLDVLAQEAAKNPGQAPEFEGVTEWINTEPVKLADLRGRVVVVHFYAFNCINCIRNLPHYNKWQKDFADQPVTIVGLQTPETDDERKIELVRKKAKESEMTHAIGFDADSKMWNAWGNDLWPTVYLIDRRGRVRYRWRGEL
ncbi:MAG TPA: redoxin domain-containing protein, partial [Pirellulales bacterium]